MRYSLTTIPEPTAIIDCYAMIKTIFGEGLKARIELVVSSRAGQAGRRTGRALHQLELHQVPATDFRRLGLAARPIRI